MLDIARDIHSLTTFRRNPKRLMKSIKKSGRPVVLTVKGKAEAVLQDAKSYQHLLDIAARADAREGIRQGLETRAKEKNVRPGRFSPASRRSVDYRVSITERAERDLENLYDYIEAEYSTAVRHWYKNLKQAILALEKFPRRHPATHENRKLRHILYGRKPHIYRVIYRVLEKQREVEILHIRHGARERLKDEDLH